jgi:glycosyltransferase involved in cell wall biosynthesis
MNIKIISCWFNTSYAAYTDRLRQALERRVAGDVGVIASNCGCSDPMDGVFFDRNCDYFEYPHLSYWRSDNPVKRWVRLTGRNVLYAERAKKYMHRAGDADVLHFQQTLNAYGSLVTFKWLALPSSAARVVTVHELDPNQTDFPELNRAYNLADRILVHTVGLKDELVALGVDAERIELIRHGVDLQQPYTGPREGIIFYGGHNLNPGKGLDILCQALALVRNRLGDRTPKIKVHGYYGGDAMLDYGRRCAADAGVAELVTWLNRIDLPDMIREYQRSRVCVIPFTGSFAGLPATLAMANDVPVIGTRLAGVPEHLGDAGVYVQEKSPQELAGAIVHVIDDRAFHARLAAAGRQRAETFLSWDAVANATLDVYRRAIESRAAHRLAPVRA